MHLYRYTTQNMHNTKPPDLVDRAWLWHAYLMRRGPLLVHLVFANEKAWPGKTWEASALAHNVMMLNVVMDE